MDLEDQLEEVTNKQAEVADEWNLIRARYGTDTTKMPRGQAERHENLSRAMRRLAEESDLLEGRVRQHQEIRRSLAAGHTESGDGTVIRGTGDYDAPHRTVRRGDPWQSTDDTNAGMISRAHSVLELVAGPATSDRNRFAEMIDQDTDDAPLLARYAVRLSDDAYRSAFLKVFRDPQRGHLTWNAAEHRAWSAVYNDREVRRASMSLTDANGGYLVPFTLDATVILTNSGVVDPIRSLANVVTIATDTWNGVDSSGVDAAWTAEGIEWGDSTPTFGQPTITPKKATAWVEGTYEILSDSGFASQLGRLISDAKRRLEGAAFSIGNTGATIPRGIVAGVAAVTASLVSSAATNALAIGDVYNTDDAVTPRGEENQVWLASKQIYSKIRQLDTTGGSAFWADMGSGLPANLLGHPAYVVSSMEQAITTGGLVLMTGNVREAYTIVDRIGMALVYNPMLMGTTNGRPVGKAGWAAHWRVGAGMTNVDALRLLQLNSTRADVPYA